MSCLKIAKGRHEECSQYADKGYNDAKKEYGRRKDGCAESRDEGHNECCDWAPCSWFCDAWVWFSNIVCLVWNWVWYVIRVIWTWVKNVVCVAWVWLTTFVCFLFEILLKIPIIKDIIKVIGNLFCGNKKPPNITNSQEAKAQLAKQLRDNKGNSPYPKLSGFDEWIAWFTTPVKENGICGWTDYHLLSCSSGQVDFTALSEDGIYTVDILMIASGHSFTVNDSNGIEKPNYMRAEIFPEVVAATNKLPKKGDQVTICGTLFWDGDGFLEIHPRNSEDIRILHSNP